MSNPVKLGLKQNLVQFSLLVLVNAFVGAMIGMERSILPVIAEKEFYLEAHTAILSFIATFGITKAVTNYFAGHWSDQFGRRHILIAGWLVAVPVPFLLMWAPSWSWILAANVFLGISQGLTWSTTVIMKIDLAGPKNRGLAMGLNEFAGYFAVAFSALATGWMAARFGLRPEPFYLGVGFVLVGLLLSILAIKETRFHVAHESTLYGTTSSEQLSSREVFFRTSFTNRNLSSVSQAGLVNNLNDGMAWGLFPLLFAAAGMSLSQIGILAAIYPAVWGLGQLLTGAYSDRVGRKGLIVIGMWTQAAGIIFIAFSSTFASFAFGSILLGLGTAMVYPTFLAVIGDVAHPNWRASSVGVYRFWRDMGYAFGALLAGLVADFFGLQSATLTIAAITFASGVFVAIRMRETLQTQSHEHNSPCIQPAQLSSTNPFIIDVRSTQEFEENHVDGAINIPLQTLEQRMNSIPRHQLVVTVCGQGGGRSEQARDILLRLGFPHVQALCGGTLAWQKYSKQGGFV